MKKNYMAPQTEAIEVLVDQVLMASPGVSGGKYISTGSAVSDVYGD